MTHRLADVQDTLPSSGFISDRTYVLAGGEVRMSGTPAELSASPAFTESFLGGTLAR